MEGEGELRELERYSGSCGERGVNRGNWKEDIRFVGGRGEWRGWRGDTQGVVERERGEWRWMERRDRQLSRERWRCQS